MNLLFNIRFYILVFSAILAGLIYILSDNISSLVQNYALTAITFLYLTLMASPVTRFFTFLPYRGSYLKGRRALGVSAFLFSSLHAYFAFFKVVDGFDNLRFLPASYLLSLLLGVISLAILFLLAATASDYMVSKLSYPRWKMLHRLVYLVALLITFHAIRLGSHFTDLSSTIPTIFFIAGAILFILEILRLLKYLKDIFVRV